MPASFSTRPTVLIAGGGAAGTLTALHLAREAAGGVDIVVVDPVERLAIGTAFATADLDHLLNVPASGMSALPDDPGHFVAWRARTTGTEADPYEFAPRAAWGRYLTETLAEALEAAPEVTLRHVRHTAVAVDTEAGRVCLTLDDGSHLDGDALVIGTGLPAPSTAWAPEGLREHPRFVADPWADRALDRIRDDEDGLPGVLVVGTGLTMVDVVSSVTTGRPDRFVHAVSRSGALPRRHADGQQAPVVPDVTTWGRDLASLVRQIHGHLREAEAATGDWRPGLDGLRHMTQDLWARLDEADRLEFLRTHAATWNRIRHRVPGPSARRIDGLLHDGRLTTAAARVEDATTVPGGLRVRLSDGTVRDVGWVVNCTGPESDVRRVGDPLLDDLLRDRETGAVAVPATVSMGVRTRDGQVVDASGRAHAPIWVLGALRRGELWESTAVPEIRQQALAASTAVMAAVRARTTAGRTPH